VKKKTDGENGNDYSDYLAILCILVFVIMLHTCSIKKDVRIIKNT
jgi:hypothetical protein